MAINTGSAGLGNPAMSDAIQQAAQARGIQIPQLQQTTQAQSQMPPAPEMGMDAAPGVDQPQLSPQKPPPSESELIVKALGDRLKMIGKVEEAEAGIGDMKPKQEPMPAPVGGGGNLQDYVGDKIPTLRHEGYPQDQATAIAFSMGRKKGFGGGYASKLKYM